MVSVSSLMRFLLCCLPVFAGMRCSVERQQKRMSEIILKLSALGELRPKGCLSEVEDLELVLPSISSENRSSVMQISFRFASELLQKNSTPTSWKARELKHLRELLGQQSQCFTSPDGDTEVTWTTFWTRLDHILTEKGFSPCAWEFARPFILHVMQKLCRSAKSRRSRGLRLQPRCL